MPRCCERRHDGKLGRRDLMRRGAGPRTQRDGHRRRWSVPISRAGCGPGNGRPGEPARGPDDRHDDPGYRRLAAERASAWTWRTSSSSRTPKRPTATTSTSPSRRRRSSPSSRRPRRRCSPQSAQYNIIISDSQWLGALAEPGWIVRLNDIIAANPELDIQFEEAAAIGYRIYPDGSDNIYGFPRGGRHHRRSSCART